MRPYLFILLLLPALCFGQYRADRARTNPSVTDAAGIGFRGHMGTASAVTPMDYCAEADSIFAHMGTTPDATRKGLINDLIVSGKANGWWAKADLIINMAAPDTTSALLWWNDPASTAVTYGAPTFAADSGYAGDGVNGYINTKFTPSTDYSNASMNSLTQAVYVRKYATIGGTYNGCDAGLAWKYANMILHSAPGGVLTTTYPATGMFCDVRTDASTVKGYQDGIFVNENTSSSAIYIPVDNVMLFNYGSYGIFNNDRISFFYLGEALTAAEAEDLAADVETFMYEVGCRAAPRVAILGNSTVSDNGAGQPAISALLNDNSEYSIQSMAYPGATILDQQTAWGTYSALIRHTRQYTFIEVGLNDLSNDGETFATVAGRYQDLVDAVRADVGDTNKIIVCTMTPAKAAITANAYTKWLQLNEAIMGGGANAITGTDYQINAHTTALNDGSGNLAAAYDSGDGIHPNAAGRQIIANSYETTLKP